MSVSVVAGWTIHHLTDRVVELRKDSYEYRRLTGADGFVRVRAEPGMDRSQMIDKAVQMARKTDETLAFRIAADLIPRGKALADYRATQRRLATAYGTPEEPELIGRKAA